MPTPATARAALEKLGIDGFCDLVMNGETYRQIALKLKIDVAAVVRWLASDPQHSARAREARATAAQTMDEKAEEVLRDAKLDPIIRRELASHYRWRAKMMNRGEYGDHVQVDANHSVVNLSDEEIARRKNQITEELARARALLEPPSE